MIQVSDFLRVDMRVGEIMEANDFPEAGKPAYKLKIDFGSKIGIKKSSAQIKSKYKLQDLVGRQIIAVVNFPAKQIGGFVSDVLVLGVENAVGDVVLLTPDKGVPIGARVY